MLRFGLLSSLLLLLLVVVGLAQGQLQDAAASSTNYLRSQNQNQNQNPRLLTKGMAELAAKTVPFAIQANIATSTNRQPSLADYQGVATAIESWFDGNSKKFYAQKQNVDSSYNNNNNNNNPSANAVPFLYAATSCRVGNEDDQEDTGYMAYTVYNPEANDGFQHKVRLQCLVDFYIASSIDSINDRGSDYARASAAVPSTAELIDNAVKSYSMMGFVTNTFIPAVPTASGSGSGSGSVFQSTQDVKYRMMGDMVTPFSVPVPTSSTSTSTSSSSSSSSSEPPASAPTSTSTSTGTCITCSTTATASTTTGTSTVTATASINPPPASAPTSTTISASTTTTTTTTITQLGRASDSDSDSDVVPCPPSNSNLRTPTRPPTQDTQTMITTRQGTTSTGNRVVNIKAILKWEIAIGKNTNRQPTAAEYTVFLNKQKAYLSKLFRDHYNNNANTPTFVSATSSYVSKEYKPVTTTTTHTKALVIDDTADIDLKYHSGGATNAPRYSHIMVIQNTLKFRLKSGQSDPPMYQWVGVLRNSDPTDFRVDYLQPTTGLWKQMGALQWTVLDQ